MSIENLKDIKQKARRDGFCLSPFLDENEVSELKNLERGNEFDCVFFGGYDLAERMRAIVKLKDVTVTEDDFEIDIYESKYSTKFNPITHRHVLGTIMAEGIKRNTFGDIVVDNGIITLFTSKEIGKYITSHVDYVNKQKMEWTKVEKVSFALQPENEIIITVASMRLDALIARAIGTSRERAQEMIEDGQCLINHEIIKNVTKNVKESDVISIRKFGRITIKEILGVTKKDRQSVRIGVKH